MIGVLDSTYQPTDEGEMMNKNDLKYDPELPHVVVEPAPGGIKVCGRFREVDDAQMFKDEIVGSGGDVIDTTPKPKIPADAEYILWQLDGEISMAYKGGGSYDWYGNSEAWTHEQLLEEVSDAKVTVLVPKEDA